MKRLLACIMSIALVFGLAPTAAFGEVAGATSLGIASEQPAKRLLYTRTVKLGTDTAQAEGVQYWSVLIPLTFEEVSGKDVQVSFTGGIPKLYLLQTGARSSWQYKVSLEPDNKSELGESPASETKIARFSASSIYAAWEGANPENGATDAKGAFDHIFVSKIWSDAHTPTISEVALVGGEAEAHSQAGTVSNLTAQDIVKNMKIGWNLGNTFDSHGIACDGVYGAHWGRADIEGERWWGNPATTRAMIETVKAKGFNTVRIPVSWGDHVYDDGRSAFHVDAAWLARVREVVDYAYDQGMYVILNTHHEMWTRNPQFGTEAGLAAMLPKFKAIWEQVATEFAGYDQRLVFEGLNEPRSAGDGISHSQEWGTPSAGDVATLNALNQAFADTVRAAAGGSANYNATRLLMVPTNSASASTYAMSQLKIPTRAKAGGADGERERDPYIAVSVHAYEPQSFTSSTAAYVDATYDDTDKARLESLFYGIYATFLAGSDPVPIVVGEFGCEEHDGNIAERLKWAEHYIALASSYGIPCVMWDNGIADSNGSDTGYLDRTASPVTWKTKGNRDQVVDKLVSTANSCAGTWGSALQGVAAPADGTLSGRIVSAEPVNISTSGSNYTSKYSVSWGDLAPSVLEGDPAAGGVAMEFSGTAPTLVVAGARGAGWCDVKPSYIRWDWSDAPASADAATGTAYFWPKDISAAWLAKDAARADCGEIATMLVRTYGTTALKRIALPGAREMPGVAAAQYTATASDKGVGIDVRQLYTRQVELDADDAGPGGDYSVLISTTNPAIIAPTGDSAAAQTARAQAKDTGAPLRDDVELAVRYTGTAPVIWFVNVEREGKWHDKRQAKVYPCAVSAVEGSSGQKVAFYSSSDINHGWNLCAVPEGEEGLCYNEMRLCVESGTCDVDEVVAITRATAQRAHPGANGAFQGKTAAQIMAAITRGYNFSGSLESNYVPEDENGVKLTWVPSEQDGGWGRADLDAELHWNQPYTTDAIVKAVKAQGFNAVRLPVSWFQHIYKRGDNEYAIDPAWMERVHEVVDICVANDLYVILNTHHENWLERIDMNEDAARAEIKKEFLAVWRQIGAEFEGYDQRLIFEGMNEPHAAGAPGEREWNQPTAGDIATVNELNAAFIELFHGAGAHASHKGRLLLVSAYGGHPEPAATGAMVIPGVESAAGVLKAGECDGLVAVSVHPYTPYSFVHDDVTKSGNRAHDFTGAHRETLDRVMNWVRERFTDEGIPVIFDEFGCYYYDDYDASRTAWMTQYMTRANELGIPCVMWPMDRTTFDRVTRQWHENSSTYLGAWESALQKTTKGSKAKVADGEHAAFTDSGAELLFSEAGGKVLNQERMVREVVENADGTKTELPVTWSMGGLGTVRWAGVQEGDDASNTHTDLYKKEIAVEYTGTTPRIALMTKSWGQWTHVEPSIIRQADASKGTTSNIAYFPALSVYRMWTDGYDEGACKQGDTSAYWNTYKLDDLGLFYVTSSGTTTVTKVALLPDKTAPASASGYDVVDWSSATGYDETVLGATCTEPGVLKRASKADPGHTRSLQGEALGHAEGDGVVTRAATATEDGERSFFCTRCGELVRTEAIPKTGPQTQPSSPSNPSNPSNPSSPVTPVAPLPAGPTPETPSGPQNPADPANPASPADPADPANPVDPAGPEGPTTSDPAPAPAPEPTCTIAFDGAGATKGVPAAITAKIGATVVVPAGKPKRANCTFLGWAAKPGGALAYQPAATFVADGDKTLVALWKAKTQPVYRLHNESNGAFRFTVEASQARKLVKKGWTAEGVGWNAPKADGQKVFWLHNAKTGANYYTTSAKKAAKLKAAGWKKKGAAFLAAESGVKVWRLKGKHGAYLFTADKPEVKALVKAGWKKQAVAFYGAKV